jgi:hypothetical protein
MTRKKSVRIRPIRPIRSPIVSQPLSCTKTFLSKRGSLNAEPHDFNSFQAIIIHHFDGNRMLSAFKRNGLFAFLWVVVLLFKKLFDRYFHDGLIG